MSIILGIACVAGGLYANRYTVPNSGPAPATYNIGWSIQDHSMERELLSLLLNIIVTFATECIGFVHSVALRAALADESRLTFTTNLRLLTAARNNFRNGTVLNTLMALLLIASYASSSMIFPRNTLDQNGAYTAQPSLAVWPAPLIILGFTLLIQATIAVGGVIGTNVRTWSACQFDLSAAAILDHRSPITYRPGRCMMSVRERYDSNTACAPSHKQPSPWHSHRRVRKVVWLVWVFAPAYVLWGALIIQLTRPERYKGLSWTFLPNETTYSYVFFPSVNFSGGAFVLTFLMVMITQSPLTLALHGAEIITNIVRDEKTWRRASGHSGAVMSSGIYATMKDISHNTKAAISAWWPGICLFIAKPALRELYSFVICSLRSCIYIPFVDWMFALAFHSSGDLMQIGPVQVCPFCLRLSLLLICSRSSFTSPWPHAHSRSSIHISPWTLPLVPNPQRTATYRPSRISSITGRRGPGGYGGETRRRIIARSGMQARVHLVPKR